MKRRVPELSIALACLSALTGCTHSPQKQAPRQSLAWILQTAVSDHPDPLLDITHMLGGTGEEPPLLLLTNVELQDATLINLRSSASDGTLWFNLSQNPCVTVDYLKSVITEPAYHIADKKKFDTPRTSIGL